ncbi:MAG: ABC transporter substrate-binding protein [Rheinheimera sp.]|nr:ABC transporter substrate-binding protein [Rheinheimera sp.]
MKAALLPGLLLCLVACQPHPEPKLRIGTNLWPGYEPLYVARDQQAFQALDVQLIEYRAAGQVLNGLRKGTINMAAVTLDEAVRISASGLPIEVIWLFNISDGADQLLARKGITQIAELTGKRIGIESNALGAYLWQRFLTLNHLNAADYELVGLDLAAHAQAMASGEVDAVMSFEPEKSKLLRLDAKALFTSKEVPGEVLDVLIVRKTGDDAPTTTQIEQFIRQYHRHFQQMQQNWHDWYPQLNKRLKLSEPELAQTYRELQIPTVTMQLQILSNKANMQRIMREYQQVLLDIGMISQPCDCSNLINTRYLEAL